MFFRPASYSVPEGGDRELTLVADKRLEVSFTVDVTLLDFTSIGKCSVHNLRLLLCMHTNF